MFLNIINTALEYNMNKRSYSKKEIVKEYAKGTYLQKAEEVILQKIRNDVSGKAILDIGVGGGRTCKYLNEITSNYIGIDYSLSMVETCKKNCPSLEILCCDARNMNIFRSDQFDLVNFSFNGIDSVSHSDRLLILKEVMRVLKHGGHFIFSSHNRDYVEFYTFKPLTLSLNPFRSLRMISGLFNHYRKKKLEIHTDIYSIINDQAHNYSLMLYYISAAKQMEQLRSMGFQGAVEVYDLHGNIVSPDVKNTTSCWLYYCVTK